jgi:hypothetical protein
MMFFFAPEIVLENCAHNPSRQSRPQTSRQACHRQFGQKIWRTRVLESDFQKWCEAVKNSGKRPSTFPVSEYLKIAESRMDKNHECLDD